MQSSRPLWWFEHSGPMTLCACVDALMSPCCTACVWCEHSHVVIYGVITDLRTYKAALMRRKRRNMHVCSCLKMSCLNVYGQKRGRVGVKQCMHSFPSLDCLLSVFFDDYMSKLFPIFYLANFVCFYPSKYNAFPPNINYIFLILPYTK